MSLLNSPSSPLLGGKGEILKLIKLAARLLFDIFLIFPRLLSEMTAMKERERKGTDSDKLEHLCRDLPCVRKGPKRPGSRPDRRRPRSAIFLESIYPSAAQRGYHARN